MTQDRNSTRGRQIGTSAGQKLGFHGVAPSAMRSGALGAAVAIGVLAGAAGAQPTQAEYAAAIAQVNALTVLVNELRACLVEKGLLKGSA